jgi:AP-1 complex subunit gamma-1
LLYNLQDADASIRKRALELVFLLVNDTNAKPLTKDLIDYLRVADPDFKGDLTAKICSILEKLVPISSIGFLLTYGAFNMLNL